MKEALEWSLFNRLGKKFVQIGAKKKKKELCEGKLDREEDGEKGDQNKSIDMLNHLIFTNIYEHYYKVFCKTEYLGEKIAIGTYNTK